MAKPGMSERILTHSIYATIANSLAGMQELMRWSESTSFACADSTTSL